MLLIEQSTSPVIKLGPFLDEEDGKTAETSLTITQADVRLSKNGGNMAQKSQTSSAVHDEIGFYNVSLNTTDTATLGRLLVAVHESGALPVWKEFMVVPANTYDSLVGSDYLHADVREMATDAISAGALSAGAVDKILDEAVDGAYTLRQIQRLVVAVLAGRSNGGGTATLKFRDTGNTKDRITATVDSNGNRTAVTINAT